MGATRPDPRAGRAANASLLGAVAPTRRKAGQPAAKGDETRARIIHGAAQCVLDEGFASASANRIAQRCGVTWGVIQYHFGDRANLFSAVVEAGYDEFSEIVRAAPPRGGDVPAQVRAIVDLGWQAFSTPLGRASIEILVNTRASRSNDPAHARHLLDMARGLHKVLDESFAAIDGDLSPTLRNVVWATLRGFVLALMMSPSDFDFERERELLVEVVATYLEQGGRP
jgi:AcrR family transcriptional regulator